VSDSKQQNKKDFETTIAKELTFQGTLVHPCLEPYATLQPNINIPHPTLNWR